LNSPGRQAGEKATYRKRALKARHCYLWWRGM